MGPLRRGAEAGRGGDVSAPRGSACMGTGARAGVDGWASSHGGGRVGVDRLGACLGRTHGWLVQVMDQRVHHPR
jgi:hypothetical protein